MITIVVTIPVQPEKIEHFESVIRVLEAAVHEHEADCLLYRMSKSRTVPHTYVNLEMYTDQAALDRHTEAAYFKNALTQFGDCLSAVPDIHYLDTVF